MVNRKQPDIERIVILVPPAMLAALDRAVDRDRASDPAASRCSYVRRVLAGALDLKSHNTGE